MTDGVGENKAVFAVWLNVELGGAAGQHACL